MVSDRLALPVKKCASVTVTGTVQTPAWPGVPEIVPEFSSRFMPDGRTPPGETDQIYGVVPPVADRVVGLNGELYWPLSGPAGVIVGLAGAAGFTVSTMFPATAPRVAEIVVVPGATPAAKPVVVPMVATAGAEEAQVTELVRSCVVESE